MSPTKVLILGRPNVGKSTLINRITRSRDAITADQPGVTRDIAYFDVEHNDTTLTFIDSGGIFLTDSKDIYLQDQIETRVQNEIDGADLVLFIVDYQTGIHAQDTHIAQQLRKQKANVWLVVNKVDDDQVHVDYHEFYRLGLGEPYPISASHGAGVEGLMDDIVNLLAYQTENPTIERETKIALVGRPNVGKSSLLNAILNEDRVIVDNKAGTTRDAILARFNYHHKPYVLIDTAGLRRQARIKDDIEYYSTLRSSNAIKSADVTVLVLDATDFLTDQDKRILRLVVDTAKSIIIFINKWDTTDRTDELRRELTKLATKTIVSLVHYPFIFGSASIRHHVHRIFDEVPKLLESSTKRVKTAEINTFIKEVIDRQPPPSKLGKRLKIFYATQAESRPPTFIFFVNDKKLLSPGYQRFLEKRLREYFGFCGVPVRLFFKNRTQVPKGG